MKVRPPRGLSEVRRLALQSVSRPTQRIGIDGPSSAAGDAPSSCIPSHPPEGRHLHPLSAQGRADRQGVLLDPGTNFGDPVLKADENAHAQRFS